MLALVAPLLGLSLGAALVLGARGLERDFELGPTTLAAASVGLGAFAPALAGVTLGWADWAFGYVVETSRVPAALVVVGCLLSGLVVPLGLRLALHLGGGTRAAFALAGGSLACVVALAAALSDRVLQVGTTADRAHGYALTPLWASPLGAALVLAAGLVGLAAFTTARALGAARRTERPRRPRRLGERELDAPR